MRTLWARFSCSMSRYARAATVKTWGTGGAEDMPVGADMSSYRPSMGLNGFTEMTMLELKV